jgi:hypothetical protein
MPSAQLWLPVHTTSHAHELLHATPRHVPAPVQPTSHGPLPHCTFRQESFVAQSMLQDAAIRQSTPLRQAPSTLHRMSHLKPAGQVTWFWQSEVVQLIVHVFCVVLQVVHWGGQAALASPRGPSPGGFGASIVPTPTQKPSLQTRPPWQSAFVVQAY